jgi:Fungal specific transcription factor domain
MQRLPSKVDGGKTLIDGTPKTPLGIEAFLLSQCPQEQRHPEPRHIFRLWQIFVENVNPLIKILHVPTFQQRIFEVSWNIPSISKPTQAIMFAVYSLAIGSLSPSDCLKLFDQEKDILFEQYRKSAMQSLIAAELLSTKDVEVLQAFVLFLVRRDPLATSNTLTH